MSDAAPPQAPWRVVLHALDNERCLDQRFREECEDPLCDKSVPNYKVMKQLALKNQLGLLYRPVVTLAPLAIPPLAGLQWAAALALTLTPRRARADTEIHVVPTTETNVPLLGAALHSDPELHARRVDHDLYGFASLCRALPRTQVVGAVLAHARLLVELLRARPGERRDLMLHARDALPLLMLARFALDHPERSFVTDDHYQRWAFVLSHSARDFRIVQHGILDEGMVFRHPFGTVQTIYVRDEAGARAFDAWFTVGARRGFSWVKPLTPSPIAGEAVFLASSFPSIDEEIALARRLRERSVPLIVKFHPVHRYDQRRQQLAALADLVAEPGDSPACRVFVSHSSSMEAEYRARGTPTISIARAGGAERAADQILRALAQPGSAEERG